MEVGRIDLVARQILPNGLGVLRRPDSAYWRDLQTKNRHRGVTKTVSFLLQEKFDNAAWRGKLPVGTLDFRSRQAQSLKFSSGSFSLPPFGGSAFILTCTENRRTVEYEIAFR